MDLLQIENVVKQFSAHRALDNVSLNVPKGSVYGLLGPNGAGKTTLIRIINRITVQDSGKVLLSGKEISREDTRNIGYLPEERGLYKKMKVGEQALYLAQLKGINRQAAMSELRKWFKRFEIESWWNRKVEELSKGMQQKIQFIVTIVHKPDLLIFDEPFSGFDPINTNILKEEILKLRDEGSTVIFSTHNMASVEEICDTIALIDSAKLVLEGKVADIKDSYKQNRFDIVFESTNGNELPEKHPAFLVEQREQKGQRERIVLKGAEGTGPNDIFTAAREFGNIWSFSELVPTMNQIFIDTVTSGDSNNNLNS